MNQQTEARQNVLKKIIHTMGIQMVAQKPKDSELNSHEIQKDDKSNPGECSHCEGEGCRFCK